MRQSTASPCTRIGLLVAVLSLAFTQTSAAQGVAPLALTRPLEVTGHRAVQRGSSGRIGTQLLVGAVAAAAVGFTAWSIVDNPEGADRRVKGDAGYTPNANTAFAIGSFVGSTLATYFIGRGDGSRGSFAATAVGAALATIPIALRRHDPYLPIIGIVLGAPLQAIGATIGYQSTRREP